MTADQPTNKNVPDCLLVPAHTLSPVNKLWAPIYFLIYTFYREIIYCDRETIVVKFLTEISLSKSSELNKIG